MVIGYLAVCSLLETYYRRTSLTEYIEQQIPAKTFNSSLILAHTLEDYHYLDVMTTSRDSYNESYIVFTKDEELPLVIEINKGFSLFEFAILYTKCQINIEHFKDKIHDIAYREGLDIKECWKKFDEYVNQLKNELPGH